jgi:hypothetical protein
LGERQLDKLEVTGSSPVTPIAEVSAKPCSGTFFYRTQGTEEGLSIITILIIIILVLLVIYVARRAL